MTKTHIFAAAFSGLLALPLAAQDTADLIALDIVEGWGDGSGEHQAGLRIALAPGWKTYWRHPGETGIAPQFDWSGSDNLAGVEVLWPHPEIFMEGSYRSIGYSGEVVLPLQITAADPDRPVTVVAQAALGVCSDICLPVDLTIEGTLAPAGTPTPGASLVRAAIATAPPNAPLREGAWCRVEPIADGLRLEAELAAPALGGSEFVFVDPGRGDIWVSPPEVRRDGGRLHAQVDLVPPDARPFALERARLRLTVLGAAGSVDFHGCRPS